jgi:hypothetical protein
MLVNINIKKWVVQQEYNKAGTATRIPEYKVFFFFNKNRIKIYAWKEECKEIGASQQEHKESLHYSTRMYANTVFFHTLTVFLARISGNPYFNRNRSKPDVFHQECKEMQCFSTRT